MAEKKEAKTETVEIKALKNQRYIARRNGRELIEKVYFDGVDDKKQFNPAEIPHIVEKKGRVWSVKKHLKNDFKVV